METCHIHYTLPKLQQQRQSRLHILQLPVELQLTILEFAVAEAEPLLINCGCDSSYPGDIERWQADRAAWTKGEDGKRPPMQPAITQVCVRFRDLALPLFYKKNVFRAHYCFQTDFAMVVKWLKLIGPENRCMLRDFCLQDFNPSFDIQMPRDILKVRRSEVTRKFGGTIKTIPTEKCCRHQITFRDEEEDFYDMLPLLFEE